VGQNCNLSYGDFVQAMATHCRTLAGAEPVCLSEEQLGFSLARTSVGARAELEGRCRVKVNGAKTPRSVEASCAVRGPSTPAASVSSRPAIQSREAPLASSLAASRSRP
jgi:hypothetical protein